MKIRKFEIRNFRNLRNIEVYPAHTTIFIGENNAGKSNLLYALRLLLDPEAKRLESGISEEDINDLAKDVTNLLSPLIPSGQGEVSIAVATEDPSQLVKGLRLNLKRQSDYRAYDMSRHGTGLQNLVLIAMFRHRISTAGVSNSTNSRHRGA
ncbi:putative ATP-dependent endonuclease of the OLD family [Methanophagales archaeon]|nr:putative ATP-dependent endonuclease of the OLD family [Methanophagales archaeon]